MNDRFPRLLHGETKIESLPIEPSYKDVIDKILEQNRLIIEQNNKIIEFLSSPMLVANAMKEIDK